MGNKDRVLTCVNCSKCVIFNINDGSFVECALCGYNQPINFEGYRGKSFFYQLDQNDLS